jgi:hypothetical protein
VLIASGDDPSASGDDQNLTAMMRLKPPRSATVHISTFLSERQQAAWSNEIERRLVEIDSGTVELISWDDVRSELFGESEWKG